MNFALVDTHCHLDMARFDDDRDDVLRRAFDAGLTGLVLPGVHPETWTSMAELGASDPRLAVAFGVHPQVLPDLDEASDTETLRLLRSRLAAGGSVAVGECGLDGPSIERGAPLERQLRMLAAHFALAREFRLPLLVHCFRAHPALLELLKTEAIPERGLLLHSYSGGSELAKKYLEHGCHFSLAGPITFLDARKPVAALKAIPLERLMLETDGPDQAPHPHRGERCEPAHLRLTCAAAARILGLDEARVAEQTTANARSFFQHPFASG